MKVIIIDKRLISILAGAYLMFCHLSVNAQIGHMDLKSTRTDTVFVNFLSNFKYDVAILYANGIEVYSNIFYSKKEIGSTYVGCEIFMTVDQVVLDVVLFERNHNYSLDYNALWYKWEIDEDNAFYYAPVKESITIKPDIDGKYVYVSLESKKNQNGEIRKVPKIKVSKKPAILD
ncbi:MAG: hypothetical protein GX660_19400 [Clostridiaceae bacterium]|nr:hypothetical protein [Clostridiaceae bacterium]